MRFIFCLICTGVIFSFCAIGADNTIQKKRDAFTSNRVVKFNAKPVTGGSIEIYSHRAGRGLMPEQTMPSYIGALHLGTDYVLIWI